MSPCGSCLSARGWFKSYEKVSPGQSVRCTAVSKYPQPLSTAKVRTLESIGVGVTVTSNGGDVIAGNRVPAEVPQVSLAAEQVKRPANIRIYKRDQV